MRDMIATFVDQREMRRLVGRVVGSARLAVAFLAGLSLIVLQVVTVILLLEGKRP